MEYDAGALAGVGTVKFPVRSDTRGSFARLFCEREMNQVLAGRHIVQINRSHTTQPGAVRGMHFQYPPHAEMKLIRCLRGRVFDVIIDLRVGSPTFLQRHEQILSMENGVMLVVPEGFAHGFQVLEADSELLYLHTAAYAPGSEGIVHYLDPSLGISWPLPITETSERDRAAPLIDSAFLGVQL